MANISRFLNEGVHVDYTPTAATYAGNIVQIGSVCAVAAQDIAASALGAVAVSGVIRAPYVGGVVANIGVGCGRNPLWRGCGRRLHDRRRLR